jgi:beta-glucanase (GH16 family)
MVGEIYLNKFLCFITVSLSISISLAQDKPGWKVIWSDEFTSPTIDGTKWSLTNEAANSNSELEYYSNSSKNAFIEGGSLILRALKENIGGRNYTSAKLTTRSKGDWLYGRIEVRAKLNRGQGIWPAIWMMPTDNAYGGWPSSGEMDIMELLGHQPAKVYGTLHWNANGHQQQGSSKTLTGATFADDYHVFGYEWDNSQQRWYIDDVLYFSTTKGQPFDKRFYLILNVAVGGSWPGNPDATTTFPNDMSVDYVRMYSKSTATVLVEPSSLNSSLIKTPHGSTSTTVKIRNLSGRIIESRTLKGERAYQKFGQLIPYP